MNNSEDTITEEVKTQQVKHIPGLNATASASYISDSQCLDLTPPIPLVSSGLSLEPDMLFGWRPKSITHGGPIPLNFNINAFSVKNCIYQGFRPEDSLKLHEAFSSPRTYPFTINPSVKRAYKEIKNQLKMPDPQVFVGMNPELIEEQLCFNSKFECGNLDKVTKVKEDEYDLYIRNDSNTHHKNQWFYFEVTNFGQSKSVKFNILNFSKQNSLYTQGMQPWALRDTDLAKGWHYISDDIKYTYSKLNKSASEKKASYSLSFTFEILSNESIKFSYSLPYSYSDLLTYLKGLNRCKLLKRESLCKSLSGVDVPLLTITDESRINKKELIFVTARVHPGETHGSWVMQGFLQFITGKSAEAARLRKLCVFKIVPMLNPDGVIAGNSRCSLNGQDLNRQFEAPDSRLHPEIFSLKELITKSGTILAYLDLHAHSKKKGVFIYGPYYPLHSEFHCKIRVIPKLISECTSIFRYYSCKFRNDSSKRRTARLVVAREKLLPYSYTVETSSYGFFDVDRSNIQFDPSSLEGIGQRIFTSVLQYIDLRNDEIRMRESRAGQRQRKFSRYLPNGVSEGRTMSELIKIIKNDLVNEDQTDSGGSDSDSSSENEQQEEQINTNIINISIKVKDFVENPRDSSSLSQTQASRIKAARKSEELEIPPQSSLAKYFSRASTENKSCLRNRTESVRRSRETETRSNQKSASKPVQTISKFSYSRGLYNLKPRQTQMMFDKSVLKSRKPVSKLEHRTNPVNLGMLLDYMEEGYQSNSEDEGTKRPYKWRNFSMRLK